MPLGHEDPLASGDHEIGEGLQHEEVGQWQPTAEETEGWGVGQEKQRVAGR